MVYTIIRPSPFRSRHLSARATHLEWVPFLAAPGVSHAQLVAAAERLHTEFLSTRPGYLRRSLLRTAEGGFIDCIVWQSADDHAAAMADAMAHPAAAAFFACLADPDAAGRDMRQFDILCDWT
jgi:hypothetical protein